MMASLIRSSEEDCGMVAISRSAEHALLDGAAGSLARACKTHYLQVIHSDDKAREQLLGPARAVRGAALSSQSVLGGT